MLYDMHQHWIWNEGILEHNTAKVIIVSWWKRRKLLRFLPFSRCGEVEHICRTQWPECWWIQSRFWVCEVTWKLQMKVYIVCIDEMPFKIHFNIDHNSTMLVWIQPCKWYQNLRRYLTDHWQKAKESGMVEWLRVDTRNRDIRVSQHQSFLIWLWHAIHPSLILAEWD